MRKLEQDFFIRDGYIVAQDLIGKVICRNIDGIINKYIITETECYIGTQDTACHASKGKTPRTKVMWEKGGKCYVYLCYGIHWLLNFTTGEADNPQGVLIRGINTIYGPGKVTKELQIDKTFYGVDLSTSDEIWVEDYNINLHYKSTPRIGIGYAQEKDRTALWRFLVTNDKEEIIEKVNQL